MTFGLCVVMLLLFLQEVWQAFAVETAHAVWRTIFVVMTLMLLLVIPVALIRDFCFAKHITIKKRGRAIAFGFCGCLVVFFVIDALILDTYIEHDISSQSFFEILWKSVTLIATALSAQIEFLTLTGIIFNALMQGYVCSNSVHVYLVENIEYDLKNQQKSSY